MGDVRRVVATAVGEPSSCVPNGAIIMTMLLRPFKYSSVHPVTGKSLPSVRDLQFASVRDQRCLTYRLVSLCYEDESTARGDEFGHMVYMRTPHKAPWVLFGTGKEKYGPIAEALEVAKAVLWLDPTAMLLRNPFDILVSNTVQADVMYLAEAPCWLRGGSAISSGLLGTKIEGLCARTQVYDKIVLATNREVAKAFARLPYALGGRRTADLRSAFFGNGTIGRGSGSNGADDRSDPFGVRVGSSFLRVAALPLPALAFLMHSYEAFRMGQISPCAASAYVAGHRIPIAPGKSREMQWASVVADEMSALLAAVNKAQCTATPSQRGWQMVARRASTPNSPIVQVSPGDRDDYAVQRILHALRNAPVVHDALLQGLSSLSPQTARDGLWMEFGSWKGRSTKLLMHASCCLGRTARVHAFDSFRGLPERWRVGGAGWLQKFVARGSFDLKGRPPFHDPRVRWHVGWFNETLVPLLAKVRQQQVSLVHIDSDLYSSASFVLSHLASRLSAEAVLVFDELINYPGYTAHEMRALVEWLRTSGLSLRVLGTTATRILADDGELHNLTSTCRGKNCLSGLGQQAVFQLVPL